MQKLKLLISYMIISIMIFSFSLPCFGNETTYVWSNDSKPLNQTNSNNTTNDANEINAIINNTSNSLNLESPSAILIEQTTGQVLYDHNSHEKLRPASVTKVMSILLIMEAIKDR